MLDTQGLNLTHLQATDRCFHAASATDVSIQKRHKDPDSYAWDTRWFFAHLKTAKKTSMSGSGHPARHRAHVVYEVRRPCQPLFFLSLFSSTLLAGHGLAAKCCESSCEPAGGLPSGAPEAHVGTLLTTVSKLRHT